jgi:hypothetical protein
MGSGDSSSSRTGSPNIIGNEKENIENTINGKTLFISE